jgi:hypothetical protein
MSCWRFLPSYERFGNYLSFLSSAVRSLVLNWNSKLSIRMVAAFAEVPDRKENRGCGGLQPSEFASRAVQFRTDSRRSVGTCVVAGLMQSLPSDTILAPAVGL